MISVLLFGLFAAASAAPPYFQRHSPFYDDFSRYGNFDLDHPAFGEEVFDTRRFWADLETQMRQMDDMINNFHLHFPNTVSTAGVHGNEYKITIPLSGFDEKEINVKAREGVLMVQAVHKLGEGSERSYLDVRNLPTNIDVSGVWTHENDVLTIVFPLKGVITTVAPQTKTENFTVRPAPASREEMDKTNDNDSNDADVGVKTSDNEDNAIQTNEIASTVEATTYAVDLKNEVEFVPVHYR